MARSARADAQELILIDTLGGMHMTSSLCSAGFARSLGFALVVGHLAGFTTAAIAQTQAAATLTKLTTVEVQQTGAPPTGPFPIVIEHDPRA